MKHYQKILALPVCLAVTIAVGAEGIYESKGQDGTVEFSDKNNPDAKEIHVDPNVVHVNPVKPLEPLPERAPKAAAERAPESNDVEAVHTGVADDYLDDHERRRLREKIEHKQESGKSEATLSGGKPGAVHQRAQHRRR